MNYSLGMKLLHSRYQLFRGPVARDEASQSWVALDDQPREFILKLWPFQGSEPDPYQRALWDSELRTLYRLGSSPAAEDTLVFIRDAGIDREAKAFVMALEGSGYDTLAESLLHRASTHWLATRDVSVRRDLWSGLINLVDGLILLHEQRVLHRNISPDTIFFDAKQGPSTLRLGGFEWSLRLGVPAGRTPPPSWSSPPEFFEKRSAGYSPETDWFSLGILVARCMINIEALGNLPPVERHISLLRELDAAKPRDLTDLERHLITQLIFNDPVERLAKGHLIRRAILDIIRNLGEAGEYRHDERPLIIGFDPNNVAMAEKAVEQGCVLNPARPFDSFNPQDPVHIASLTEFIRKDLCKSQIFPTPMANIFIINGGVFTIKIAPFETFDRERGQKKRTWAAAFCIGLAELRVPDIDTAIVELDGGSIIVQTVGQIHRTGVGRLGARSWEAVLPRVDRSAVRRASLSRFHEFVRCTNQLELLMRTGEIFAYTRIDYREDEDGLIRLVIQESSSGNPLTFNLFKVDGGMADFLLREVESRKPNCR